jgi:glycosyltransferase involved in cell wall biosynthesis
MEAVKDPLNLARAFIRALDSSKKLRLVLVGDGTLRAALHRALDRSGVRERVWFAGERTDIPQILRGLDCFVLPSLAEGVSNTILEAMATRLAIVATRVGGNAELIEAGMTGLLVPPADSDALAQAMLHYAADPALARRYGRAARSVAEGRFSLARMVSDYGTLYERVLAAAGVPVPPATEALSSP